MSPKQEQIRLLMVDDEEEFLTATSQALERRGFAVTTARNGPEALDAATGRPFDVALLDIKMPGMDGVELFIKLQRKQPGLPMIFLTGHGTVSQAFAMAKRGAFDYVAKPCPVDDLAERLREAVRSERPRGEAVLTLGPQVRVLLVDDEVELLESLQPVLERRGLKVMTAASGEKGLAILDETVIDVVVLDIKMPGLDGLEVLRRIKAKRPEVEVVLLTGHPTLDTAREGLKLGACEYLVKPPEIGPLTELIQQAYERRRETIERIQRDTIRDIISRLPG
jgi:DNA-binding NtrC family response regulator